MRAKHNLSCESTMEEGKANLPCRRDRSSGGRRRCRRGQPCAQYSADNNQDDEQDGYAASKPYSLALEFGYVRKAVVIILWKDFRSDRNFVAGSAWGDFQAGLYIVGCVRLGGVICRPRVCRRGVLHLAGDTYVRMVEPGKKNVLSRGEEALRQLGQTRR
jgi:hypothetical protein